MGIIATEVGMLGKKNIGRVYGASLATIYSTLLTGTVYGLLGGLRFGLVVIDFRRPVDWDLLCRVLVCG